MREPARQAPAVTVVMAVYNGGRFVEAAVESLRRQSEPDFELVVMDDGSTDETASVLSRLASTDGRIRTLRQANSGKPSIARNAALQHGNGTFVSFLDGDDLYHPDKLRRQLEVFRLHPEVDVVFADVEKFTDRPHTEGSGGWLNGDGFVERARPFLHAAGHGVYVAEAAFYRFMSAEMVAINTQTVMIRRAALEREPYWFNQDILIGEDADLFFRLARRCRIAFIDEVLAYYRQHADSLTHRRGDRLRSEIRVHSDNLDHARPLLSRAELVRCRQHLSRRYHDLGYLEYAAWNRSEARRAYTQALMLETRLSQRVGILADLLKTWAPAGLIEWRRRRRRPGGRTAAEQVTEA